MKRLITHPLENECGRSSKSVSSIVAFVSVIILNQIEENSSCLLIVRIQVTKCMKYYDINWIMAGNGIIAQVVKGINLWRVSISIHCRL